MLNTDDGIVIVAAGMPIKEVVKLTRSAGSGKLNISNCVSGVTGMTITCMTVMMRKKGWKNVWISWQDKRSDFQLQPSWHVIKRSHTCMYMYRPMFSLERVKAVWFSGRELASKRAKLSVLSSSSSLPMEESIVWRSSQPGWLRLSRMLSSTSINESAI